MSHRFLNIYLTVWLLTVDLATFTNGSASECAERCSKAYTPLFFPGNTNQAIALWWGSSLILAMLSNVSQNSTMRNPERAAQHSFELQCEWFRRYNFCLRMCPTSTAKDLLLTGITVPLKLCTDEYSRFMTTLPCLSQSRHAVKWACKQTQCWVHSALFYLDTTIRTRLMCKAISAHDSCFHVAVFRACGTNAGNVMRSLQQSSLSMLQRLNSHPQLKSQLPETCKALFQPEQLISSRDSFESRILQRTCSGIARMMPTLPAIILLHFIVVTVSRCLIWP